MSNFWDSIIGEPVVEASIEPVSASNFWAGIGLGSIPKVVEQSKPKAVKKTAKKSKAVAQAEIVYETIEGLVVPAEDCIHYYTIPSETAWAIGVCQKCNGEKWFSNRYTEQSTFNDTYIPPKVQQEINDALKVDADVRDMHYNAEQDSIEERE